MNIENLLKEAMEVKKNTSDNLLSILTSKQSIKPKPKSTKRPSEVALLQYLKEIIDVQASKTERSRFVENLN